MISTKNIFRKMISLKIFFDEKHFMSINVVVVVFFFFVVTLIHLIIN
jgi:hypothetical protein